MELRRYLAALLIPLLLGNTTLPNSPELVTDLGTPEEEKEIPKDIFLTLGTALMASSALTSCGITNFNTTKIPLLVLAGAGAVYLFREVTIKEEFEKKSKLLLRVEKWKTVEKAQRQREAFIKASEEQELAAEAADKKASNAKFLQRSLYLSAALFLAFPLVACSQCGLGYLACLPTHNACKDSACSPVPGQTPPENPPSTDGTPAPEVTSFIKDLLGIREARAFNVKKLGIISLGALLSHAKILGGRIASVPDIGKSAILGLLALRAGGSKKKWEEVAEQYRKNAKKYASLGKSVEVALRAQSSLEGGTQPSRRNVTTSGPWGTNVPIINSSVNEKPSFSSSACATGPLGEMVIDRECKCKASGTCSTMGLPPVDFSALGMPDGIASSYDALREEGNNALGGGRTTKGAVKQQTPFLSALPAKRAAFVQKWKDSLENKYKERMPGEVSFDDVGKKAIGNFHKALLSSYKDLPPNLKASLGNMGGKVSGYPGQGEQNFSPLGLGTLGPETLGIDLPSLDDGLGMDALGPGNFFGNTPPLGEEMMMEEDENMGLGNLDITSEDIHHKTDKTIWRIITFRYFRSAYPTIFKEKPSPRPLGNGNSDILSIQEITP